MLYTIPYLLAQNCIVVPGYTGPPIPSEMASLPTYLTYYRIQTLAVTKKKTEAKKPRNR